jgi:uncharacterized protein (DUF305 family)
MSTQLLIYSLVGSIAGSTIAAMVSLAPTYAQSQGSIELPSLYTQVQPPVSQLNPQHSSGTPVTLHAMGMMNREQAERHFVEMMIPHHQAAVDLANLALERSQHPEIQTLAESIKTTQLQEIEQMKNWYAAWYGTEVPVGMGMGMGMHSGEHSPMHEQCSTHMMSMMHGDLAALETAEDFDKAFIEQMIPHHQMAVMMSAMVLDSDRPELRDLGQAIIQTQTAEIKQMQEWHQTWYR